MPRRRKVVHKKRHGSVANIVSPGITFPISKKLFIQNDTNNSGAFTALYIDFTADYDEIYISRRVTWLNLAGDPAMNGAPGGDMCAACSWTQQDFYDITHYIGLTRDSVSPPYNLLWGWSSFIDGEIIQGQTYLVETHLKFNQIIEEYEFQYYGIGAASEWIYEMRVNGGDIDSELTYYPSGINHDWTDRLGNLDTSKIRSYAITPWGSDHLQTYTYDFVKIGTTDWGSSDVLDADFTTLSSLPGPFTEVLAPNDSVIALQ